MTITDLEMLLILIVWAVIVLCIYEAAKTGALAKIFEMYANEINPNIEEVTRCEDCKFYDKNCCLCFLHWNDIEGNVRKESCYFTKPNDYCSFAEKRANDDA